MLYKCLTYRFRTYIYIFCPECIALNKNEKKLHVIILFTSWLERTKSFIENNLHLHTDTSYS